MGLLFALLAAFAVFAMVAGQWRTASADVTAGNFCLDEFDSSEDPVVPECVDHDAPATIQLGQTLVYKVSILPLSAATLGNLRVVVAVDDQIISVSNPGGGLGEPTCVIDNDSLSESRVTCTYTGPIPAGASGTLLIATQVTQDTTGIQPEVQFVRVEDLGSAQGPVEGTNQTDFIDVHAPYLTVSKTTSPAAVTPSTGDSFNFVITVTNSGELAAPNVTVTDEIPAVFKPGVMPDGCSANGQNVTCTAGTLAGSGGAATFTIPVTVVADTASEQYSGTVHTNIAAAKSTVNGVDLTASGSVDVTLAADYEEPDVLPDPAYTTLVAWAGQRIVLEADFRDFIVSLLIAEIEEDQGPLTEEQLAEIEASSCGTLYEAWGDYIFEPTSARFVREAGDPGEFVDHYISLELGNSVAYAFFDEETCRAFVVYQSTEQGEVHVDATLNSEGFDLPSSRVSFLIYYLQLEDVELGIVTDQSNSLHNVAGADWLPGNPWAALGEPTGEPTEGTANVSADVLLRGRVRGWFTNDISSGRPAEAGKPAGRWILPDDWNELAGGDLAAEFRPTFDRMFGPNEGQTIPTPDTYPSPNGVINEWDAPMPPALITVALTGSGFLREVSKDDVYYTADGYTNPFYAVAIPSHPFLNPTTGGGNGYLWNTWGYLGSESQGPYPFWAALTASPAATGDSLTDAEKAELAAIAEAHGGHRIGRQLQVYSDNHGEFMVVANGDFKFSLANCDTNALSGGKICKPGDEVGSSTIYAVADYPDVRTGSLTPKASNNVAITWEWGGYHDVTIEPDPLGNDQFVYVVYHALDRDGYCEPVGVSRNPVLGQEVDFIIDSGSGQIIDTSAGAGPIEHDARIAWGVTTHHVDEDEIGGTNFPFSPLAPEGTKAECQAWIKVSNSVLGVTNVLVVAHDNQPEGDPRTDRDTYGDLVFDVVVDFQSTQTIRLNYRWSLKPWFGPDNIPVADALAGTGANSAGNDITEYVTAVYGWDGQAQKWLGYFPNGVDVPGANDLTVLENGEAYWIAINEPAGVDWVITTNAN